MHAACHDVCILNLYDLLGLVCCPVCAVTAVRVAISRLYGVTLFFIDRCCVYRVVNTCRLGLSGLLLKHGNSVPIKRDALTLLVQLSEEVCAPQLCDSTRYQSENLICAFFTGNFLLEPAPSFDLILSESLFKPFCFSEPIYLSFKQQLFLRQGWVRIR